MLAVTHPTRTSPAAAGITKAEWQVLLDVSVGLTDEAMAGRHSLSRRGVQNRLASVYRKLGVHRTARGGGQQFAPRSRMVFKAIEMGLLTPNEILCHAHTMAPTATRLTRLPGSTNGETEPR